MTPSAFEKTAVATAGVIAIVTLTLLAGNRPHQAARPTAAGPLTFFVADGDSRTGFVPPDRQLAVWAFEAWARSVGQAAKLASGLRVGAYKRLLAEGIYA